MKSIRLVILVILLLPQISCNKIPDRVKPVVVYKNSGASENIILENEFLELRFFPETAEIILTDRASGVQWRSNPQDFTGADPVTQLLMESQFSLEYSDVSGIGMTMFSGSHSVSFGAYDYVLDDTGLEVRYTVGDIERGYIIPPVISEERMRPFLDKMEGDDRRKVEACFRLYDINNLRSGDDKRLLLANYPDLSREKLYVMRDNTQEYMKEMIEGYFETAGYTYDDYFEDTAAYTAADAEEKPAFNITFRYTLDGKSLVLSVPFDNIAYRQSYLITQLTILPFMGSGSVNDDGYMLVPDGSGALIYFNNGKQNQIPFNTNMYGWDEAMPRDAVVSDSRASYPVFGIHKNDSALLCVIENGSAYASVRADVSGRNCSWNSVYSGYDMIHGAVMEISGRTDRPVYLYEKGLPAGESITIRYTPCSDSGYVGMAKEYRSWLLRKHPFLNMQIGSEVPVAVEIIGAVNKTIHRLGIPFDLPLKLTSYSETESMIRDFAGMGWENVSIKITGWFNRSVDHTVPVRVKLIKALGTKGNFKKMIAAADRYGFKLFPEADFLYVRDVKLFDGYSLYRDSARYVNRKRVEKYPYSFVWFGERNWWGKLAHLARPASMFRMVDSFIKKSSSLGLRNIAFRNMGAKLSGDYNEKRAVSREAAMKMRQEKLDMLSRSGTGILLDTGFVYTVPWTDFITGMVIGDQSFGITDVSVPFYQIVLHGLVPYTGKAINLAEDYTKNLLKTIECGAGLYFSFMTEEAALLQETKFRQFYANEYDKWAPDADSLYRRFSEDFTGLYSQAITDHFTVKPGVTVTEYEDGTKVIVNVGAGAFVYDGIVIDSDDYTVLRRE